MPHSQHVLVHHQGGEVGSFAIDTVTDQRSNQGQQFLLTVVTEIQGTKVLVTDRLQKLYIPQPGFECITAHPDILFNYIDGGFVTVKDALDDARLFRMLLQHGNVQTFNDMQREKISIHIVPWGGEPSLTKQIRVASYRKGSGWNTSSRHDVLRSVARVVDRFLKSTELGGARVSGQDVCIIGLKHVGRASWQPIFGLCDVN